MPIHFSKLSDTEIDLKRIVESVNVNYIKDITTKAVRLDLYAIILFKESAEFLTRIEEVYPHYFPMSRSSFLVCDSFGEASNIAVKLGIKHGPLKIKSARGIVFTINGPYSGCVPAVVWNWLDEVNKRITAEENHEKTKE